MEETRPRESAKVSSNRLVGHSTLAPEDTKHSAGSNMSSHIENFTTTIDNRDQSQHEDTTMAAEHWTGTVPLQAEEGTVDNPRDTHTENAVEKKAGTGCSDGKDQSETDPSLSLLMQLGKKKKKPKGGRLILEVEKVAADKPYVDDTRDGDHYSYEELLKRLRGQLMKDRAWKQKEVRSEKFTIPIPLVVKSGRVRTTYVNFLDTVNKFHRPASHLLAYMNSELGTICTICSTNQLWIKGNFKAHNIETVLKQYAKTYVLCPACRSSDTLLRKESRLTFLLCDKCNAKFSVGKITNGYRARTQLR